MQNLRARIYSLLLLFLLVGLNSKAETPFSPPFGLMGAASLKPEWIREALCVDPKVSAIAQTKLITLVSGGTHWGICSGHGFETDLATGEPIAGLKWNSRPHIGSLRTMFNSYYNRVAKVIPDGLGGWFIAGNFNWYGSNQRNSLIRVAADGTLYNFNPQFDETAFLTDMVLMGDYLYVVGGFGAVAGLTRQNFVKIHKDFGTVDTGYGVNTDSPITSISTDGTNIFVSGDFALANGQSKFKVVAFNANTGVIAGANPIMSEFPTCTAGTCQAHVLRHDGASGLIVAGNFLGTKMIKFNTSTWARDLSFNPPSTIYVNPFGQNFEVWGSSIYAIKDDSGAPSYVRLNKATGAEQSLPFALSYYSGVSSMRVNVSGDNLILSGITSINGAPRSGAGAYNLSTNTAYGWNPKASGLGYGLGVIAAVSDAKVFTAGQLYNFKELAPGALLAWSTKSQRAVDHNLIPNGTVNSIVIYGKSAYIAGDFTEISGIPKRGLAKINIETMSLDPFDFGITSGGVNKVYLWAGTMHVVGNFNLNLGAAIRKNVATFELQSTPVLQAWSPNVNGPVTTIHRDGGFMWIAGAFTSVDGQVRSGFAEFTNEGALTSWNPAIDGPISSFTNSGAVLIVGGSFASFGGNPRNNLVAINVNFTSLPRWYYPFAPNPNGPVTDVAFVGSKLFVTGSFSSIGPTPISRPGIAQVDVDTSIPTAWLPGAQVASSPSSPQMFSASKFAVVETGKHMYIFGQHYLGDDGFTRDIIGIDPATGERRP